MIMKGSGIFLILLLIITAPSTLALVNRRVDMVTGTNREGTINGSSGIELPGTGLDIFNGSNLLTPRMPELPMDSYQFMEYSIPTSDSGTQTGINIDRNDNLWFVEIQSDKIGCFSLKTGAFSEVSSPISFIKGMYNPKILDVDSTGSIWYTAFVSSDKVARYVPSTGIFSVFTVGSGPCGLVVDSKDNIWFTELFENKIGKISSTGIFTEYPVLTENSGPTGICVGSDGNIWFTEDGMSSPAQNVRHIGKLEPATGTITEFQFPFSVPYLQTCLNDILSDSNGNLWFVEIGNGKICKFVPSSQQFIEYQTLTANSHPYNIDIDGDGNLWFTENAENKIGMLSQIGDMQEFAIPTSNSFPMGIVCADGRVWFAELQGNKIGWLSGVRGNLKAISIEPVQVVWSASLVKDKASDFKLSYESTYDTLIGAYVLIEAPGFDPSSYQFRYKFAPGSHSFVIGNEINPSPLFVVRSKPQATCRFTIDPIDLIPETDETDNKYPSLEFVSSTVKDTRPLKILFVATRFDGEDGYPGYFNGYTRTEFEQHIAESIRYLRATYPLAESEISYYAACFNAPVNAGPRPTNELEANICLNLLLLKLHLLAGFTYDRVIGIVRTNWFHDIPGWDILGYSSILRGLVKGVVSTLGNWKTTAHEIGHTYDLDHNTANGIGYYVSGRTFVDAPTLMKQGANYKMPVPDFWIRPEEYSQLLNKMTQIGDPEVELISGMFWQNGSVNLYGWSHSSAGTPDLEDGDVGNYTIVQVDSDNNFLSSVGLNVTFVDDLHNRTFDRLPFAFSIPYETQTKTIRILDQLGHIVATRNISNTAPTVNLVSPNGGEILSGDSMQVSWNGSDADGDQLVYNLLISGDGGLTWNPIATNLQTETYNLTLRGFCGGNEYTAKVIASDGTRTAEDTSDGFFTISSFAISIDPLTQNISPEKRAEYIVSVTSYGGYNEQVVLNASAATSDSLTFQWPNGSTVTLAPNSVSTVFMEVDASLNVEGGNHVIVVSGISASDTEIATASLWISSHDIAITSIETLKNIVAQGFSLNVTVFIRNQGNFGEAFNAKLYANQTETLSRSTYLPPKSLVGFTFILNTSSLDFGNYSIMAYVEPVDGETSTLDNNRTGDNVITITISGDVNGDFTVDIYDAILLAGCFNSVPGSHNWNPNTDINGDNLVDIFDAIILAGHFNQHYP